MLCLIGTVALAAILHTGHAQLFSFAGEAQAAGVLVHVGVHIGLELFKGAIEQGYVCFRGIVLVLHAGAAHHSAFLKILCEKGTLRELGGCTRAYRIRYNEAHGILEATATSAIALTKEQTAALHQKLEALTGKTIDLQTKVDPAVLGGIRLDIDGTELDGTVQNRLAALRRNIAAVTL